ncbi:hypothetical protein [Gelidibacter japonicus]|uniref:hypothetical protein n=1 Tax=Gelidibacter japonicus TaxID=1962232 RepID=UPI002B001F8E|nr:hypothetical protein [Gelidibacter japonicus]
MINSLKSTLSRNITNARGWKTDCKIVVIESDDWGSIRMPSKEAVETLKMKGFKIDQCAYMQNDCLESNEDMESLFDFLESRKKRPVLTANFLTANPDFDKIKQSGFEQYYYESLGETLLNYPNHDRVKQLWLKGVSNQYFIPQLHGREHLNVKLWMKDLKEGNKETLDGFDLKLFGISANTTKVLRPSYQAAFGMDSGSYEHKERILSDAYEEFFNLFGFHSKTFIAPNYVWDEDIELILSKLGVSHFQGSYAQTFYNHQKNKNEIRRHHLGEKNKLNQKYLVRNVVFEPFSNPQIDWVSKSFKEINNAFFWNKPAIVSMHRVNFIGSINPENRSHNLQLLDTLLNEIEKRWPEVEYMSSAELAKLI